MAALEFLCAELPQYTDVTHQTGSEPSACVLSCPMFRSWPEAQRRPVFLELPAQDKSHLELYAPLVLALQGVNSSLFQTFGFGAL